MEHEIFMQRCVDLAYLGQGNVSPNPMVGCVIVKNGLIIGEGYHSEYGGKHAEIKAIESVIDQKEIENSTVYISLEPCVHHGKTPPCVHELINRKIKTAVIGSRDSNPINILWCNLNYLLQPTSVRKLPIGIKLLHQFILFHEPIS